jgi:hypothetical protein
VRQRHGERHRVASVTTVGPRTTTCSVGSTIVTFGGLRGGAAREGERHGIVPRAAAVVAGSVEHGDGVVGVMVSSVALLVSVCRHEREHDAPLVDGRGVADRFSGDRGRGEHAGERAGRRGQRRRRGDAIEAHERQARVEHIGEHGRRRRALGHEQRHAIGHEFPDGDVVTGGVRLVRRDDRLGHRRRARDHGGRVGTIDSGEIRSALGAGEIGECCRVREGLVDGNRGVEHEVVGDDGDIRPRCRAVGGERPL